jgi:hypothetical protein
MSSHTSVGPKKHLGHGNPDGSGNAKAPKWAKHRTEMASEFPSPFRGGEDPLALQIGKFVTMLDRLRPEKGGPAYLGKSGALTYKYPDVKNFEISQQMGNLDAVLGDVVKLRRLCRHSLRCLRFPQADLESAGFGLRALRRAEQGSCTQEHLGPLISMGP